MILDRADNRRMDSRTPPFAVQRLVFLSLLLGIAVFAVVVAFVLQSNDGHGLADPRVPLLDTLSPVLGAVLAASAFTVRSLLQRRAARQDAGQRSQLRFSATLVPLAQLEAGALFGLVVWLLNGNPVPGLVVACVLFSLAVWLVPFHEPPE